MPNFLEFLRLVDDFRISNVYQRFFTLNILLDEVTEDSDMKKTFC